MKREPRKNGQGRPLWQEERVVGGNEEALQAGETAWIKGLRQKWARSRNR